MPNSYEENAERVARMSLSMKEAAAKALRDGHPLARRGRA